MKANQFYSRDVKKKMINDPKLQEEYKMRKEHYKS